MDNGDVQPPNFRMLIAKIAALSVLVGVLAIIFLPSAETCTQTTTGSSVCTSSNLASSSPMASVAALLGGLFLVVLFIKWKNSTAFLFVYGFVTLLFIIISFGIGWPLLLSALLAIVASTLPAPKKPPTKNRPRLL